jgi:1,4-alpha-glucan branching enzyme
MTHPGAKLNFMGNEIAQFIEWRYYEGIQYFLTEQYESHAQQQHFIATLNKFYTKHPALWQKAYAADGFEWINADDAEQSIISFVRHGDNPEDDLVILINFDPATYEQFRLGLPRPGKWKEIFNTDAEQFGGSGVTNSGTTYESRHENCDGRKDSVVLRVPPIGGLVLAYVGPLPLADSTKKPTQKKRVSTKRGLTSKTKDSQGTSELSKQVPKGNFSKKSATATPKKSKTAVKKSVSSAKKRRTTSDHVKKDAKKL